MARDCQFWKVRNLTTSRFSFRKISTRACPLYCWGGRLDSVLLKLLDNPLLLDASVVSVLSVPASSVGCPDGSLLTGCGLVTSWLFGIWLGCILHLLLVVTVSFDLIQLPKLLGEAFGSFLEMNTFEAMGLSTAV